MSRRVDARQLAKIWIVTPQRVNQLARQGRIVKGADGKFDFDDAMAFRRQQVSEQEVQVLLKSYGSRHGTLTGMKAADHVAAAARAPTFEPAMNDRENVEAMLMEIGLEFINELPISLAKRFGGGTPDAVVLQMAHDEVTARLHNMQCIAIRHGYLEPDAD